MKQAFTHVPVPTFVGAVQGSAPQRKPEIKDVTGVNLWSFTLIEVLVVVTIISLLTAITTASYARFSKQSRDAKRKADIEQIRAAIEMYKSNSITNQYPAAINFSTCTVADISDSTVVPTIMYLKKPPNDPKCPGYQYLYTLTGTTYKTCAFLESLAQGNAENCGTVKCNYCLGPFGQE